MPATSSRACSTADRDHRPDDADALAQATDDQVGLTSGELAHLVLVDAGPRPRGERLAAGQLLVVDLPGTLGHPFGPGEAGQLGRLRRPEQQDAAGGREQPGALLLAAERDAGLASEDDTGAGGQGGWQHTAQGGHGAQEAASGPREADQQHG